MARKKRKGRKSSKGKSGLTRPQWRKCKGVNSRTGRVKKGYRNKGRGCPVPVS